MTIQTKSKENLPSASDSPSPTCPPTCIVVVVKNTLATTSCGTDVAVEDTHSAPTASTSPPKTRPKYLGMLLAFLAALLYSLSALTVKVLDFHPFNLGIWRFSCMVMITFPFLIHGELTRGKRESILSPVWPFNTTSSLLVLQAILGSNSIMLVFYGLSYLNIGDSIVVSTSAPVFVTIVAHVALKERFGVIPLTTAIVAVGGVAVICKPPILTGNATFNEDTLRGVVSSVISMLLLTVVYVILRYLRKIHHSLIQFTFAMWGLIESFTMAYGLEVFHLPDTWREVALIVTNALLAFGAQTCITLSLKYEQAGMVSLIRVTEVIFCYFWQALFLCVQPDLYSIIGAVIILVCVVVAALRKTLLELPEEHKCKRYFRCLLW